MFIRLQWRYITQSTKVHTTQHRPDVSARGQESAQQPIRQQNTGSCQNGRLETHYWQSRWELHSYLTVFCFFVWLFIIHCPIENIFLIWMRHHCLLRATKLFCLVRKTVDQWGTFIVPRLLWHKASVFAVSFSHFVRQARGADDIPVMLCSKGI